MDKFTIKCLGCIVFLLSGVLLSAVIESIDMIILTFVITLIAFVIFSIQEIDKF